MHLKIVFTPSDEGGFTVLCLLCRATCPKARHSTGRDGMSARRSSSIWSRSTSPLARLAASSKESSSEEARGSTSERHSMADRLIGHRALPLPRREGNERKLKRDIVAPLPYLAEPPLWHTSRFYSRSKCECNDSMEIFLSGRIDFRNIKADSPPLRNRRETTLREVPRHSRIRFHERSADGVPRHPAKIASAAHCAKHSLTNNTNLTHP